MPLPDEPASLPVHGPFLRPKSAAPSASSIMTATAMSRANVVDTDMDDSAHMASPVEPLPAASPESTSSIDTEASCSLQLQMEVIHDFWRDRADTTVTSPDESLQVLAAEAPVEPPTLPPLDGATTGGLVPALGADGETAPWQRRQSRRLHLTSPSTTFTMPEAPADEAAAPTNEAVPLAEGSVSRLAYLRARLAASAARRRLAKCSAMECRTSTPPADMALRWMCLVPIFSSQVAGPGKMSPLLLWCLGPGVVIDCRVSCRSCVTPASLHDACWCMSRLQPGLRWAIGRTSPSQSRVACAADHMQLTYRYQAAPHHMHRLAVSQSMIIHLARPLVTGPSASMGTSKASKRRQAQRPGRRERAVERGGAPAAGAEGSSAEEGPASSSSQWLNMASSSAATSLPCSSDDHSVLAWATGSDAMCHHATLVPPIPPLLRVPASRPPVHTPADSPPLDEMDKYMPVPEGLSFDHLDTLGAVAPYVYHLPFQDTLISWSRRWLWGLRFPPAFDDHTELAEDCVLMPRDGLRGATPTCSDSSPELIPAAGGLCSAFCLDEAEANVAASKELLPPHLQESFCNCLSSPAFVPQGPRPPRQQAGILLRFDIHPRSSCHRRRLGGGLPMHSIAHCAYLGFWRPCSALYNVYRTVLRPLRPGDVPAHSPWGGGTSAFELLVIAVAAWQTLPGCDVLLPTSAALTARCEDGASACLPHTGDACNPCSGGSDSLHGQCRSGPCRSPHVRLGVRNGPQAPCLLCVSGRRYAGDTSTGVRGQKMVLCQPFHHLTGGGVELPGLTGPSGRGLVSVGASFWT